MLVQQVFIQLASPTAVTSTLSQPTPSHGAGAAVSRAAGTAASSGATSGTSPTSSSGADSAVPLSGWVLVAVVLLVAAIILAMFVLTFYNLSAPRSTMRNFFGLKWHPRFLRRGADEPASPFDKLLDTKGASQASMMKLLDTLGRSARVGKRTTRTTLAITGFSLLCVLTVAVLALSGEGVRDLRTQVAAGVITLVATIAGFYFGSQTVADAANGGAAVPTAGPSTFARDADPTHALLQIGTAAQYAPVITGVPPASVALTTGRLPAGLTMDPSSGAITGTPAGPIGAYPITLTALYPDNTYRVVNEILTVGEAAVARTA